MAKRDVWFSLLLGLAALLTLGLKAGFTDYALEADGPALTRTLQARLMQQGFTTSLEQHQYQSDVVEAVRGPCRLRVRDGSRASAFAGVFELESPGLGPVRYFHHGLWFASPPLLRMKIENMGAHIFARLNLLENYQPALAISAQGCDLASLDLTGIVQPWARKQRNQEGL